MIILTAILGYQPIAFAVGLSNQALRDHDAASFIHKWPKIRYMYFLYLPL